MKTIKKSLRLFALVTLFTITNTTAQEFSDILDTVYLTKATQAEITRMSYDKLHAYLIEKESFNFSREIKVVRSSEQVLLQSNDRYISASSYLRLLKKAANKSETNAQFYREITKSVPQLKQIKPEEGDVSELYTTLRGNTINGKLEGIGNSLTWL